MGKTVYYTYLAVDDRKFLLAATTKGLSYVGICDEREDDLLSFYSKQGITIELVNDNQYLSPFATQLTEYFEGTRQEFDFQVDFGQDGTLFQREVWQELMAIPYGKTSSYSQLAEKVKRPKATRAVGTAVGKNPIPIVVPCHRVLRKDGGIGGYAGGLDLKRRLLAIEKIAN